MAIISNNDIARAIYLASKDMNKNEQTALSQRVIKFLSKRRLLSKSRDILSRLGEITNKEESRVVAKVTTPEKLDSRMRTHLEQALKKRYSAKEIFFKENLDSKLLGGYKIEVNDEVIDLSIKNKIGKLQEHLIKSV